MGLCIGVFKSATKILNVIYSGVLVALEDTKHSYQICKKTNIFCNMFCKSKCISMPEVQDMSH